MFHDVEKEQARLAEELLEEERDEQAEQYLSQDDETFPEEPEEYCNYANDYGRSEEKSPGGLIAVACILAGGILLVAVYWLLRLTGVI